MTSFHIFPPDETNLQYYLGDIAFATTDGDIPEDWRTCKISFSRKDTAMVFDDSTTVYCKDFKQDLKGLITCGIFAMQFQKDGRDLYVKIYIILPLPRFDKKIGKDIKTAFSKLFPLGIENDNNEVQVEDRLAIEDLYRRSVSYRNDNFSVPAIHVQHRSLKPRLRNYQEDAVRWMIQLEKRSDARETLHPLYEEKRLENGVSIYFNKYTGDVQADRPAVSNSGTGGILADEMGLGKTIEVLACILCHPKVEEEKASNAYLQGKVLIQTQSPKPKPGNIQRGNAVAVECICGEQSNQGIVSCVGCTKVQHKSCFDYKDDFGEYKCPQCWMKMDCIESKGTLIVTPVTLYKQWHHEISKHLTSLKVLLYEGSNTKAPVYPTKLLDYDIVLTTYKVLKDELPHVEEQTDGKTVTLRKQSRYSGKGCSLAMIKWWRICLDEAQQVAMPKHKISVMAKKLKAHHRWAVTGTPISQEISSLYGLIDYLQLAPYDEENTWNNALYWPYRLGNPDPMIQFLAAVLWRSFKDDVIDQMSIPPQTIIPHFLTFSPLEKYYYEREHELCESKFLNEIKGYSCNQLLKELEKKQYDKVMAPLLSIRQACSHPTATKGGYLTNRNRVTSIDSFINEIIRKNDTDINSILKNLTATLNELGDVHYLQKESKEALEAYCEIIELTDNSQIKSQVDIAHLIHAVYNANEIHHQSPSVNSRLQNRNLQQQLLSLKEEYKRNDSHRSSLCFQDMEAATKAVSELQTKFTSHSEHWYIALLNWVSDNDAMQELQRRIQKSWEDSGHSIHNITEKPLTDLLTSWENNIKSVRATLTNSLKKTYSTYIAGNTLPILDNDIDNEIKLYTDLLYYSEFKGSEKPTKEELALRALTSFVKSKSAPQELMSDGEFHIKILNSMKQELKQMKKMRDNMESAILTEEDISSNCEKKKSDRKPSVLIDLVTQYQDKLTSKLQRRDFLEKCKSEKNCSKCKSILSDQYSILSCCHCYCLVCIQSMLDEAHNNNVECCDCKELQKSEDVSYAGMGELNTDPNAITITGRHSTKIEAITRVILELKQNDDDVKILVFSTWKDILKRIEEALKLNGVAAKLTTQNLAPILEKFKSLGGETALLMPIELGAKGLNVTEATHVILVEPLQNPADELQAIGRIHRIGQESPTFVHKFVMKRTIESVLYQVTSSSAWDNNKVTLQQLKDFFDIGEEDPSLPLNSEDNLQSTGDADIFDDKSLKLQTEKPSTSFALDEPFVDETENIKPVIPIKGELITEEYNLQGGSEVSCTEDIICVEDDDPPLTPNSIKIEPMPSTSGSSSRKRPHSVSHDDNITTSKRHILEENFSAFGTYVATELNKLPPENANYLKKRISDAIFEATAETLSRNSKIVP